MASTFTTDRDDYVAEFVGRHTGAGTTVWEGLLPGEVLANVEAAGFAGMEVFLVLRVSDGAVMYRDEAAERAQRGRESAQRALAASRAHYDAREAAYYAGMGA